jgi:hypothetical protein
VALEVSVIVLVLDRPCVVDGMPMIPQVVMRLKTLMVEISIPVVMVAVTWSVPLVIAIAVLHADKVQHPRDPVVAEEAENT